MNIGILKIGLNYLKRSLFQSFLLLLGVAVGVSTIVAVDIANMSSIRSLESSIRSINTNISHSIVGSSSGFDEKIYTELRSNIRTTNLIPVVEGYLEIVEFHTNPVRIIGLDPIPQLSYLDDSAYSGNLINDPAIDKLISIPNTVFVSQQTAEENQLTIGNNITSNNNGVIHKLRIVGIIESISGKSESLKNILITDISTAQELLNKLGKIDKIDIFDIAKNDSYLQAIELVIPENLRITELSSAIANSKNIIKPFELNLLALSMLAILVAMFLIYNSFYLSINQRKTTLGTLRAIGATKKQIFLSILFEAIVVGSIATFFGIVIGIVLGKSLLILVTRTINDIYFNITANTIHISNFTIIKGIFVGLFASVISTIIPAWIAMNVSPIRNMRQSDIDERANHKLWVFTALGLFFSLIALISIFTWKRNIEIGLIGIFLLIIGISFFIPALIKVTLSIFEITTSRFLGIPEKLAIGNIKQSLSTASVIIIGLMIAVSVYVSVELMIGSFRNTVSSWLDTTLSADVFITTNNIRNDKTLPHGQLILRELQSLPNISGIDTSRHVKVLSDKYGPINLIALTNDISIRNRKFIWKKAKTKKLEELFKSGELIISENFAYKKNINNPGQTKIELLTDVGLKDFKIAGVYKDYASQSGSILIDDSIYRANWDDKNITSIAIFIKNKEDIQGFISRLKQTLGSQFNLKIQSDYELKKSALTTFNRTFKVTSALRILTVIVAFIGILASLISLELKRKREIGILKASGMVRNQIRRMVLFETGTMGLLAGAFSIPLGILMSIILIFVINVRSFGWTIDFSLDLSPLFIALLISLISSLSAGIYPSYRFEKLKTVDCIRDE